MHTPSRDRPSSLDDTDSVGNYVYLRNKNSVPVYITFTVSSNVSLRESTVEKISDTKATVYIDANSRKSIGILYEEYTAYTASDGRLAWEAHGEDYTVNILLVKQIK